MIKRNRRIVNFLTLIWHKVSNLQTNRIRSWLDKNLDDTVIYSSLTFFSGFLRKIITYLYVSTVVEMRSYIQLKKIYWTRTEMTLIARKWSHFKLYFSVNSNVSPICTSLLSVCWWRLIQTPFALICIIWNSLREVSTYLYFDYSCAYQMSLINRYICIYNANTFAKLKYS